MTDLNPKPINFWSFLATCFPFGLAPFAPGTFGSIPGIIVGGGLGLAFTEGHLTFTQVALSLVAIVVVSFVSIEKTEALWKTHDDKAIVIDELAGQAIPLAFFPMTWQSVLIAFLLFRFFDIVKPGPIGWIDRTWPRAWGTLFDDIVAGVVVLGIIWGLHFYKIL